MSSDYRIGSWELSKKFEVEHRHIRRAIDLSMKTLLQIDLVYQPKDESKRKARRIKEYLLTPKQWMYVLIFFRSTKKNSKLKDYIYEQVCVTLKLPSDIETLPPL